ncbi:Glycoside hydrolase family 63 protein [Mycena indigotica]|uniref:rRNA adenine N(6)-methyltransferase n=1 Tax=Mycena indigotica TaxID=2126181 RepID=A0A8H6TBI9_9AGAR|nr:Glycoside hydrolase family 63 protein [Mycena indigotica]KAF7315740.1 Glycoside hydrolase family 63 protein [Mycena indigotica]
MCVTSLFTTRVYSTAPDYVNLPPQDLWRKTFPPVNRTVSHRVSLANPKTAAQVANAFVPSDSRDKTIVEAFPGPGQLTRALLALPKTRIKQLIVLEKEPSYLAYLKPLEATDSRLKVIELGGELWITYLKLQKDGVLGHIDTQPWDTMHSQLQFISHLPNNVSGEQLLAQLLRSIPDRQWLFKYGRVPLSFMMSETLWDRVTGTKDRIRCKLSIISAAVAQSQLALPMKATEPYNDHFHPIPTAYALKMHALNKSPKSHGNPFVAVNFRPSQHQVIAPGLLDKWDYCLRHLYVHRAKPIKTALPFLAPNAQTLLTGISGSEPGLINPSTIVRNLSLNDWKLLVKAFDEWPFAPEELSVTDAIMGREEKHDSTCDIFTLLLRSNLQPKMLTSGQRTTKNVKSGKCSFPLYSLAVSPPASICLDLTTRMLPRIFTLLDFPTEIRMLRRQ